jgi:iron complex transport system ATP-binding protein
VTAALDMAPAIELSGVSVGLAGKEILADVDLRVATGEWIGLIGPNGAGKTTLLRSIAGLIPASGSVRLHGESYAARQHRMLARTIALVPQLPQTPPALTVAEYVLLGRTPHISYLGSESEHDRQVSAAVIERLHLQSFADRVLGSLSGGERQRVVIARALAQQAPILLLDEPTSALDLGRQQEALELLDELRCSEELTIISAMHDITLAGQYTDRLALMQRGRIVVQGTAREVLTPELIARCYGAEVRVIEEDGSVVVLPTRPSRDRDRDRDRDRR